MLIFLCIHAFCPSYTMLSIILTCNHPQSQMRLHHPRCSQEFPSCYPQTQPCIRIKHSSKKVTTNSKLVNSPIYKSIPTWELLWFHRRWLISQASPLDQPLKRQQSVHEKPSQSTCHSVLVELFQQPGLSNVKCIVTAQETQACTIAYWNRVNYATPFGAWTVLHSIQYRPYVNTLAAPVLLGMMLWAAARPPLQSFIEGPSTVFCVAK